MYTIRVHHVNMISVDGLCDTHAMSTMGERLRLAREKAQFKSARSAALKHGWGVSTYAAHENGQNNFDHEAAAAYAKAFKTTAAQLLLGDDAVDVPMSPTPPAQGLIPANKDIDLARVDGEVQAGVYKRIDVYDDDRGGVVSAPRDPAFPFARQIAYRVAGDSMNAAFPQPIREGDFIICAAFEDTGLKPKTGMKVVIEHTLAGGHIKERSVKQLELGSDHAKFLPISHNKAHVPIFVKKDLTADDGSQVSIIALVRYVFSNEPLQP